MLIGVPKEVKDNEFRVALVPSGVRELISKGHTVVVEEGAGVGSGISDEEYIVAGAEIKDADGAWSADIVIKVKEPQASEYRFFREGLILFTFLHLASDKGLAEALLKSKTTAIGYETLEETPECVLPSLASKKGLPESSKTTTVGHKIKSRRLPILKPMSEVAGRIGVLEGCHYLTKPYGGVGVLPGGITGVENSTIAVLGAGTVGMNSIEVAVGIGADVVVVTHGREKLQMVKDIYGDRVRAFISNKENIEKAVLSCHMLVGAVHVPGEKTPYLVSRELVRKMKKGAVIIDVAVDQGGCVETTRPTTHSDPVYTEEGVIHYCVSNMPGAVPRTSTFALTNASLPYLMGLVGDGLDYLKSDPFRVKGINIYDGKVVNEAVAHALNMEYSKF